jgi:hypothetical protein
VAQRVGGAKAPGTKDWRQGRRWSKTHPPPYTISADDRWCNETRRRGAQAIGAWLLSAGVPPSRTIYSLQLWELEGLAEAVVVAYIAACAERYEAEKACTEPPIGLLDG